MNTPRVAVVGAGEVGGYFGAMLARADAPVTLIERSRHVDVWKRNGLFLESANFHGTIPVQASTELDAARDADLVPFTVKAVDTEETARQLAHHLGAGALVISLQNGMENLPLMRAAAARDPVAAVVYVASAMPMPGRVKHGGRGDLLIGDLPGRRGARRDAEVTRLSAWFEAAGVPCRASADIEAPCTHRHRRISNAASARKSTR